MVLTGDLVDDADPKQYRNLQKRVLEPLRQKFTVLAAPGNHDFAPGGFLIALNGPKHFKNYVHGDPFPTVKAVKYPQGKPVAFVGLDTGDPENRLALADGSVDKKQLNALVKALNKHKDAFVVTYLHHHPFYRKMGRAFERAEQFLQAIQDNVNLVLFGHKHVSEVFYDRFGVPLMLASGKVTQASGDALAFRIVELDPTVKSFGTGLNGVRFFTEEIPAAMEEE